MNNFFQTTTKKLFFLTCVCVFFSPSLIVASSSVKKGTTPEALLAQYGWTTGQYTECTTTIPKKFTHEPGAYPAALYWAWNNELSQRIGLNLKKYRGKTVHVRMYTVTERLPESCAPFTDGKAMIVLDSATVVGAWIASNGTTACSLDKQYANGVAVCGMEWSTWLQKNSVKTKDVQEKTLALLMPQEIMEQVCDNITARDYAKAFSAFSRRYLLNMMLWDITQQDTIASGFSHFFLGEIDTVTAVKLVTMIHIESDEDGVLVYVANTTVTHRNTEPVEREWVVFFKKEIPSLGWRIADIRRQEKK